MIATGPFEVKVTPSPPFEEDDGISLSRFGIAKTFRGALTATSAFDMIAAGTPVKGSGAYVALERIVGTLDGKNGSFIVAHVGFMNRGAQSLTITIVPDSGTGELRGIAGTLAIKVDEGKHSYVLDYTLG